MYEKVVNKSKAISWHATLFDTGVMGCAQWKRVVSVPTRFSINKHQLLILMV